MTSIHIIYASTSGNTEYVITTLLDHISSRQPDIAFECHRVERVGPEDLLRGDLVILGSGTWNTGGREGQLNMHMDALLRDRAKGLDMKGKPITFISLGDDRYYFRTRCTEHFLRFQREHNATLFVPPFILVNEPYGQEEKIRLWGDKLLKKLDESGLLTREIRKNP